MSILITVFLIIAGSVCLFLGLMLIVNQAAKGIFNLWSPNYPLLRWVAVVLLFLLAALCFWMAFTGPLAWTGA